MKEWIDTFILVYFFVLNSFYLFLLLLSVFEIARRKSERLPEMDDAILEYGTAPPISIIAPAYNEAVNIVDSVRSLLEIDYPDHRVIVVNDGSDDDTLERLLEHFDLVEVDRVIHQKIETQRIRAVYQSESREGLTVVDKENGGKGDALNAGINASRTPLVCCIDADTIVDRRALLRMIEPYIYNPENVVAVGGTVRVANGCKINMGSVEEMELPDSWLARFQIVEYLRAFLFGRIALNRLGGNIIISGAFGLFLKEAVVEVGGYNDETVGEDMELVVRLHRYGRGMDPPRRVVQIPEPICYTRVPEDTRTLGLQRDRWHRGLADSLWRHLSMIGNPRYGPIGTVIVPTYLLFELLGPVVELFGYAWFLSSIVFGFVNWTFAGLFVLVAFFWGALLSVQSLLLDNWSFEMFREGDAGGSGLVLAAIFENFGYRQMTLIFRLRGLLKFFLGEQSWGRMKRKGFEKSEEVERAEAASGPSTGGRELSGAAAASGGRPLDDDASEAAEGAASEGSAASADDAETEDVSHASSTESAPAREEEDAETR